MIITPLSAFSDSLLKIKRAISMYDIAYLLLSLDGPISDLERIKFKEIIEAGIKKRVDDDNDLLEIDCLTVLAAIKKSCEEFLKKHCDLMPNPTWTVCHLIEKLKNNIKETYQYAPVELRAGIFIWIFLAMCDKDYTEYEKVFIQEVVQASSCAECNVSSIREAEAICATIIDTQKEIDALGPVNENNQSSHNDLKEDLKSMVDSMQNFIQFA